MSTATAGWWRRHGRALLVAGLAVAVLGMVVEGFFLYQERITHRDMQAQSDTLLTRFLSGDTAHAAGASGVAIRLQNVRFKWSDNVYIDAGDMAIRAVPLKGTTVAFDDLETFRLKLQRSVVRIPSKVLQGMFNESVFNYPGSKVRDLQVSLTRDSEGPLVELRGKINVVVWVPFAMWTKLSIDHATNTLVIDVDHLKVFGFPATRLLHFKPMNLENLMSLPPNKSLMVHGNRIMVKPFGLFPPPRIDGTMSKLSLNGDVLQLEFSGPPIPAPEADAKNYVFLRGGISQFGHFRLLDTNVLIVDRNQRTPFDFSIPRYAAVIPKSDIEVHDTKRVLVRMPDF
ncbi:MAG: hypothetical protein E6K80_01900 [Candidatus Eisenbacteria bacterium]|uniref:DUF2993 domain-containing protein n=1 Tax=Eiseniibacteriota bacterium TaxID=2212470 RepID=A0A538UA30_UNCEI|nr:MAG: hypothetical protein E6K80_01900 [Candidatus Eisenbacteria bacterium]